MWGECLKNEGRVVRHDSWEGRDKKGWILLDPRVICKKPIRKDHGLAGTSSGPSKFLGGQFSFIDISVVNISIEHVTGIGMEGGALSLTSMFDSTKIPNYHLGPPKEALRDLSSSQKGSLGLLTVGPYTLVKVQDTPSDLFLRNTVIE